MAHTHITMRDLAEKAHTLPASDLILDVRGRDEYGAGHVPGSANIPHDEILQHLDALRQHTHVYVYCKSGGRSGFASDVLSKMGLTNVTCISGSGMPDWVSAGFPVAK
jgi:rhodanese-related sulfurtransferase